MSPLLSQFLQATGATGSFRLELEDPVNSGSLSLEFTQPFVRIGRRPNMDLRLDHWQVSRRHAYLQVLCGRLVWVDLGSRTGTYAEGQPGPSGWLTRSRGIWIGPYAIKLGSPELDGPPPPTGISPLSARMAADIPLPRVTLEFPESGATKSVWKMRPAMALIGGAPTCRVRFLANSPDYVSSLVRTQTGVWVVDLLGQGVSVNGSLVRVARLEEGDMLEIGQRMIRVHYDSGLNLNNSSSDSGEVAALLVSRPIKVHSLPALEPAESFTTIEPSDEISSLAPPPQLTLISPEPDEEEPRPNLPQVRAPEQTPATIPSADLNHPVFQPLVRQFAMMQQEMMDQFQESMLSMMTAFGDLYREQMGDMRKEMDELRTLTEELRELQAKVSQAAAAPPVAPAPVAPAPPPFDRGRIPTPPTPPSGAFKPTARTAPLKPVNASPLAGGEHRSDAVDHAEITRRIAEIQAERSSKLQSIMGRFMGGKSAPQS